MYGVLLIVLTVFLYITFCRLLKVYITCGGRPRISGAAGGRAGGKS